MSVNTFLKYLFSYLNIFFFFLSSIQIRISNTFENCTYTQSVLEYLKYFLFQQNWKTAITTTTKLPLSCYNERLRILVTFKSLGGAGEGDTRRRSTSAHCISFSLDRGNIAGVQHRRTGKTTAAATTT